MNNIIVAMFVFAGVAVSGMVTWLVARRQNSGSVSTSDAATLWVELNAIKDEYKDRSEKYELRLEENNRQLQEVLTQLTSLQGKSDKMGKKIDELKRVIAKLRAENQRLLAERRGVKA